MYVRLKFDAAAVLGLNRVSYVIKNVLASPWVADKQQMCLLMKKHRRRLRVH